MPTLTANSAFNADAINAKDNTSVEQNDKFWSHATIDTVRWNMAFPYQLILVKRDSGKYIRDSIALKWTFTLPITPAAVTFDMPFGIRSAPQLTGFYEQHGGAPVRNISMQGTTGVLPNRGSADTRQTLSGLSQIFGGTVNNIKRTVQAANGITVPPNIVSDSDFQSDAISKTTGYYQFRKLQEFFENYSAFKKTEAAKDYIMALAIWKDQAVYLVTPTRFTVSRSAESPYEYPYSLTFRAWKRVQLDQSEPSANVFRPVTQNASKLGKMLQGIDQARRILEGARASIAAVGGDIDHAIFEPLRELTLFVKDAVGVTLAVADLPIQIVRDMKQTIIDAVEASYAVQGIPDAFDTAKKETKQTFVDIAAIGATTTTNNPSGVPLGKPLPKTDYTDKSATIFDTDSLPYDFFSRITTSQMNLPPVIVRRIINEKDRVRQKTRLDFEQQRDTMVQAMADFADLVGAGSATFNATYSRPTVTTTRTPSPDDFQVMFAMNKIIIELNRLAASGMVNQFQTDSINYVAGLATRSGIAFTQPVSKFAVPYPYGMTIEQLATRYLGTPDRWIEIATLNGLRAPYVDEVGFDLLLLVNGHDNIVEVADSSNLFIGQQVWLSSTTTSRTSRHIVSMEKISETRTVLGLDGNPDLARFVTLAQAQLHAFLPDTVNSMMQIYIPSQDEPGDQDYKMKSIPGINYFDPLVEAAGVDVLLTESLDLAVTPDGDCRLAVGLQNIVQTARIRLSTQQGTLNRHPTFGLAITAGISTADADASDLLNSVKNLFQDDPTFTGVSSASVLKQGPTTSITLMIGVQGVSQTIPVGFKLQL